LGASFCWVEVPVGLSEPPLQGHHMLERCG
jgi:hypothetical protein